MHYTLHQLRIFLKISQVQSVTKTSEELHLTQPAISIQLKKFQEQFTVPLFEVVGRQLYITDFGHEVALAAKKILEEVDAINYKTHLFKNQIAGRLKISVVSTAKYVMPYFLSDFLRLHAGVELAMDVTNKGKVIKNLEENEVDFSLVSVVPAQINLERLPLLQNKLFLVGSPTLSTSIRSKGAKILDQYPLIFREAGSATRLAMESYVSSKMETVRKKLELTSNEAVKQAVMAGLGISIMPLIGLRNELSNNQLEIINIKDLPIVTQWNLVWPAGKKHSPVAQAFLDYINQHKARIIDQHFDWYEKY